MIAISEWTERGCSECFSTISIKSSRNFFRRWPIWWSSCESVVSTMEDQSMLLYYKLQSLMKECISTSYPLIEARYAKLDRIEDHTRSCYGRIKELKGTWVNMLLYTWKVNLLINLVIHMILAEEDVCTMITNMADLLKSSASRLTKLEERY